MEQVEETIKLIASGCKIEFSQYMGFIEGHNKEIQNSEIVNPKNTLLLFDVSRNIKGFGMELELTNESIYNITSNIYDIDKEFIMNDIDLESVLERFCEAKTVKEIWLYKTKENINLYYEMDIPHETGIFSTGLVFLKKLKTDSLSYWFNINTMNSEKSNAEISTMVTNYRKQISVEANPHTNKNKI